MDISIIIVSYNVMDFLRGAIQSVQRALEAGKLTGEILVIDNDSSDESAEMVAREFPQVRLYPLQENLGFGRANNRAMREAKGEYLLLLNPDTIVAEDTLRRMFDFMREHPDAGMAGCKLLNGDGSFQLSCRRGFPTPWASFCKLFGLSRFFPNSPLFARYNLTYLPIDATYEVDALGGAFMMMSRAAYHATNGFDEDYFMYGEDLDLCYRVQKAGLKVYYVHDTATIHFKGESTRRSAINEVSVFYEAMHIFVKKNYGASPIFGMMLRIGIMLRTLLALVRKQRGAILSVAVDYATAVAGVYIGCYAASGSWHPLPAKDYPYAIILPPLFAVIAIAMIGGYQPSQRRRARKVLLALPLLLVVFSSLTYFFKEYPSSRQLVLFITATIATLLLLDRVVLKITDRLRWGGHQSATPLLKRTLIVGTTSEAVRIAQLLKRTEFLRGYEIIGFLDRSLAHLGTELTPGAPVLGDTQMIAKVIRDQRITEVIFANDSLSYAEMLASMQRVSAVNLGKPVNFNVVPTASDVLIGRTKIELLTGAPQESLALLPLEYNLARLSHRFAKRALDLALSAAAILGLGILNALRPSATRQQQLARMREVLRGDRSLVGIAGEIAETKGFAKRGLTSLARVAASTGVRTEDIEQFDHYYARHHTIGMDLEILIKTFLQRKDKRVLQYL
jgi:GT2 family glycosyltransferase